MRSDLETAQMSTYRFPDALRAEQLLLRAPTEADVDVVAPAFLDPRVGGEAGAELVDGASEHVAGVRVRPAVVVRQVLHRRGRAGEARLCALKHGGRAPQIVGAGFTREEMFLERLPVLRRHVVKEVTLARQRVGPALLPRPRRRLLD